MIAPQKSFDLINQGIMTPTTQQLLEALRHVRFEIASLLLVPEHKTTDDALSESVSLRRMVSGRALYHFFSKDVRIDRKNFIDDDVLCQDFCFPSAKLYGQNKDELLQEYNKRIFHITFARYDGQWKKEELLNPVIQQSLKFIDHIIASDVLPISADERNEWQTLKVNFNSKTPLRHHASNVASPVISAPFPVDAQIKPKV